MKKIKLSEFKIIPITASVKRLKISDDEYFSNKYSNYISNSKLGLLNSNQGGSPDKFKNGFDGGTTSSLMLGSAVHQLILQPESFKLGPKCHKPTAKLGATIDRIKYYRDRGESIYDSIVKASQDCDYYVKQINSKISKIIREGLAYYLQLSKHDDSVIMLPDKEYDACIQCVNNVLNNKDIVNTLLPCDDFGNKLDAFNEDTILLDVAVLYKKRCAILKLKMKADNWTIDTENCTLTLNDLKTTSKPVAWFMNPEYGSFYHYHYYRQFAMYKMMLETYCAKEYGFNYKWKSSGNVLVVNTTDYNTRLCRVNDKQLELGTEEYETLLKQIAYYELFGYSDNIEFI